ncbi:MAG TPA: hypothetical protein VFK36_08840 [Gemmatimonadales bacterium]|nr:hypothetical protein [Gemmatimonadales bacterium]
MAHVAGWVLSALALAGGMTPVSAQSRPICLVLGAGQWSPPDPGSIWSGTKALQLVDSAASIPDSMLGHTGWREVRFADAPEPDADLRRDYDFAWGWLSPTPDSLLLVRPAMLSQGMIARGAWSADTLRARGVTFADLVRFPMPRANMYAVGYPCGDARKQRAAFSALAKLQKADLPDPALNAAEDRADSMLIASQWDEATASTDWIPVDRAILEMRAMGDTLPPEARDSVLDAVVDEFALTNFIRPPSVAEHTYLSPYRRFGFNDTLAVHDPAWLDSVRVRYSLAGVCAGSGSRRCPEGDSRTVLAVSAPAVLPNGLVLVATYRYSEPPHSWGAATTPVYLIRLSEGWSVLCHGVSLYDDGSR